MKILILKPSSLGDVVQALPILRCLKRQMPEAEIYWWVDVDLIGLLKGDPDLTGIVPFRRKHWASPRNWDSLVQSIFYLRNLEFDWVIDLQGLARSGTFAWLTNGKLTIGVDDHREGARGFYDLIVPRPSPDAHAVEWYLSVLDALRVPRLNDFVWLPERPMVQAAIDNDWGANRRRWILLNPSARWLNKRWPVENYRDLLRELARKLPDHFFGILGSDGERSLAEEIAAQVPDRSVNLAGKTSLAELVEWIRACDLMVTNDTGPMHIAAALGKPVVAVFGPTDPQRTGPYQQGGNVLQLSLGCVPCLKPRCHNPDYLACLKGITADLVINRIASMLDEQPRRGLPADIYSKSLD